MKASLGMIATAVALMATAGPAAAYDKAFLNGTTPYVDSKGRLVFDGMRVLGDGLTLKDAVRAVYRLDPVTLDFSLLSATVYKDVGVFSAEHMAKDVEPRQPTFRTGGRDNDPAYTYTFEAGEAPVRMVYRLKAGHSMSWIVWNQTAPYTLRFTGPGQSYVFTGEASQGVIVGALPILIDGTYTFTIAKAGAIPVTFDIQSYNANARAMIRLVDGTVIDETFRVNLKDYAKFVVGMKAGQTLALDKPTSDDIRIKLVDRFGSIIQNSTGLPLIFTAPRAGDYYVFVDNIRGWGGSYTATVRLTSPSTAAAGVAGSVGLDPASPMPVGAMR
ncbi:hypothetical protein OHA_1_02832 [Pleomorphomonas sp. SM30]|uniref:Pre-peptidase n=2 Tax=Oharaeibacter diazotrophicus TaxID=1920512 RepID=A0A4R6RDP1_9HYPH|nr:hypothetical protein EDD54_2789 [Oharaeibacter diazotrophicus]BBE73223.1 hypothetical protein OHA_1_02832 [Pleomorphomonas sp. SM30]